jgi:hypothetical protein
MRIVRKWLRGGRHDAYTVPDGVRLRTCLVCADYRFCIARSRRGHDWISQRLQSNCFGDPRTLCMVPHAEFPVSRLARRSYRRSSILFRPNSGCSARCALVASGGVVLCLDHVLQRSWTHSVHHSWPYGRDSDFPASCAGILFIAISLYWIRMADEETLANGASTNSRRSLTPEA